MVNISIGGTVASSFWVIEFDWERKEFHIGDEEYDVSQIF
jgi:hypothetical protein